MTAEKRVGNYAPVFWGRIFYALFGFSAIGLVYNIVTDSFSALSMTTQLWVSGFVLCGLLSAVFWTTGRAWHNAYEREDGKKGFIRYGGGFGGVNSGDYATDPNSAARWLSDSSNNPAFERLQRDIEENSKRGKGQA